MLTGACIVPRLFDSYVMVDWSAASKPNTDADSIWIGSLSPDARRNLQFRASNPPTRAAARKELEELLGGFFRRGDRVLLGFDFSLGYPTGTAQALGLSGSEPWAAMASYLGKEIKDKPDNSNNRFPAAAAMNRRISNGPFPFWGCPAKDAITTLSVKQARKHEPGELAEYRAAETYVANKHKLRPQSVWKLAFPGSVGSQTLLGIAFVQSLRAAWPNETKLWPFETGWTPLNDAALADVKLVIAEIYPSLVAPELNPGEVKDLGQVRAIAKHFAALDEANKLGALFGPPKDISDEVKANVAREEGWILGA